MTEELNISEQIDFTKSNLYTLSVRLSTDEFAFSICDPTKDKAYTFSARKTKENLSMAANVKEAVKENEFFKHSYKKVNIMMETKRFTLIPFDLFEDEMVESVFYHNHPKQENEIILYNILKKANVVMVFAIDKSVHLQFIELFPNVHFYCQASSLVEYFAGRSKLGNCLKMYAHLHTNTVNIICYDRGRLLLINEFKCNETADIIYYLLYIWKQLDFNQERDELHLTGTFKDKEALTAGLKQFVRQLYIINPNSEFSLNGISKSEEIPFDLHTLSLCEL